MIRRSAVLRVRCGPGNGCPPRPLPADRPPSRAGEIVKCGESHLPSTPQKVKNADPVFSLFLGKRLRPISRFTISPFAINGSPRGNHSQRSQETEFRESNRATRAVCCETRFRVTLDSCAASPSHRRCRLRPGHGRISLLSATVAKPFADRLPAYVIHRQSIADLICSETSMSWRTCSAL